MIPVQPGWIIQPVDRDPDGPEFYMLVGWKGEQPVIALGEGGISEWQHVHGTDGWMLGIIDVPGWLEERTHAEH